MRKITVALPLMAFALLAACSESTGPTAELSPSYAKGGVPGSNGGGGGVGSPHFTDGTVCTYDSGLVSDGATGTIRCDYQIAGLGANSSGVGTLVANIPFSYACSGFFNYETAIVKVQVDFYIYTDKKGNAKGTVQGTPSTSGFCLFSSIVAASREFGALNANASPVALPLISGSGSWGLFGISSTQKGGAWSVYYGGGWTEAL